MGIESNQQEMARGRKQTQAFNPATDGANDNTRKGVAPKSKGIKKKKAPEKKAPAKKTAKKTTKKDAPKEKKAPGPYMVFCKEQRPKIIKADPKLTFGEVGKALGAAWKKLSDAEKAKYKK